MFSSLIPRIRSDPDPTVISFQSSDVTNLLLPHHDALVIQLSIASYLIKRILIDNGSSANIIFLDALKEMQISESNIVRKSTTLIGFSGEHKATLGEITLPIYAEGMNLNTKLLVMNSPSAYNVIMGRP